MFVVPSPGFAPLLGVPAKPVLDRSISSALHLRTFAHLAVGIPCAAEKSLLGTLVQTLMLSLNKSVLTCLVVTVPPNQVGVCVSVAGMMFKVWLYVREKAFFV